MTHLINLRALVTKRSVMVIIAMVFVPSLIAGILLNNRDVFGQEDHIFDDLAPSLPEAMKNYDVRVVGQAEGSAAVDSFFDVFTNLIPPGHQRIIEAKIDAMAEELMAKGYSMPELKTPHSRITGFTELMRSTPRFGDGVRGRIPVELVQMELRSVGPIDNSTSTSNGHKAEIDVLSIPWDIKPDDGSMAAMTIALNRHDPGITLLQAHITNVYQLQPEQMRNIQGSTSFNKEPMFFVHVAQPQWVTRPDGQSELKIIWWRYWWYDSHHHEYWWYGCYWWYWWYYQWNSTPWAWWYNWWWGWYHWYWWWGWSNLWLPPSHLTPPLPDGTLSLPD